MKLHENEQQAAEEEGQLVVVVQPLPHAIPPSKEVGLCTASLLQYLFGYTCLGSSSRAREVGRKGPRSQPREQDSSFFCVVRFFIYGITYLSLHGIFFYVN